MLQTYFEYSTAESDISHAKSFQNILDIISLT